MDILPYVGPRPKIGIHGYILALFMDFATQLDLGFPIATVYFNSYKEPTSNRRWTLARVFMFGVDVEWSEATRTIMKSVSNSCFINFFSMNYVLSSLSLGFVVLGVWTIKRVLYIIQNKKNYLFCFKAKLNQSKAKSDIPKSQNEENKILTLFTSQAVKILQNLLSNGWDRIYMTILIPLGHENKKLNGEKGTIFWQFVAVAHAALVSVWIQLNPVFSISVCILLKLGPMRTGGNARLLRYASFQPQYLNKGTVNSIFVYGLCIHKYHFSIIFLFKISQTELFTYLKIILLSCIQFQFSFSMLNPKRRWVLYQYPSGANSFDSFRPSCREETSSLSS